MPGRNPAVGPYGSGATFGGAAECARRAWASSAASILSTPTRPAPPDFIAARAGLRQRFRAIRARRRFASEPLFGRRILDMTESATPVRPTPPLGSALSRYEGPHRRGSLGADGGLRRNAGHDPRLRFRREM